MSRNQHHEMTSPISFWANVLRLPQKGMPVKIVATEEQRRALAEAHELVSVERLQADLLVTTWKRNGVRVKGTVSADIVQACVVTLEPVPSRVEEEIDSLFLPQDSKLGRQGFEGGGEILISVEGDDSPETFEGDSLDIGALAEEFFGLGIDPYPRKTGAALEAGPDEADKEAAPSPLQEKLRSLIRKD